MVRWVTVFLGLGFVIAAYIIGFNDGKRTQQPVTQPEFQYLYSHFNLFNGRGQSVIAHPPTDSCWLLVHGGMGMGLTDAPKELCKYYTDRE